MCNNMCFSSHTFNSINTIYSNCIASYRYLFNVYLLIMLSFHSVLLVAFRMYNYSVFTATAVGEGPSADGSFLTREDSES